MVAAKPGMLVALKALINEGNRLPLGDALAMENERRGPPTRLAVRISSASRRDTGPQAHDRQASPVQLLHERAK